MRNPQKAPPTYAIASVDHALRLAAILQLEGKLTVAEAAERLGVARSTAHRLLQMLVYRDFAMRHSGRDYCAGPILELAEHSGSATARLRSTALPHMQCLMRATQESVNLTIRTGAEVRFIASVESPQALRVGTREGMVFPAHRTSGGMVLLAGLTAEDLHNVYQTRSDLEGFESPNLDRLRVELTRIRKQGFAVNQGRSERGVVAIGVPVLEVNGGMAAGLSVSMPSVRYDRHQLQALVANLKQAADRVEADLAREAH